MDPTTPPRVLAWRTLQSGIVAAIIVVTMGLLGLLVTFNARAVVQGVASVSQILVFVVAFICARNALGAMGTGTRRVASFAVGLASASIALVLVSAFARFGPAVFSRQMFINASPDLFTFLAGTGSMILAGGIVAAFMREMPRDLQQPLAHGMLATALIGLLSDQFALIMGNHDLDPARFRALLAAKGLTPLGAVIVFALASGARYVTDRQGAVWQARLAALPPDRQRVLRLTGSVLGILVLLGLPRFLGSYHSEVLNQVGLFILMGLGLNIVVGFAGMLDLGYVAFFALGAYTVAILTSPESFLAQGGQTVTTFWGALPVAILIAVLAGVVLGVPVLRLRGDYLAIVTLGFGEIIRLLALSEWLKPYLGGAQGIAAIHAITIGPWGVEGPDKPQRLFYILLVACLIAAFVATRLKDSSLGRAWLAIREDEDVAEAMGIHLVRTKLMAFAIGAAFSGLAGSIFGPKLGSIYPHSFSLLISINILALIIVGGMGSIAGVIIGALALVGLPELLREFAEYRLLVYGAVLVAMMLFRPEGLLPATVTKREVHARDTDIAAEVA